MAKEIKSVVKIGMDYTEVVGGVSEVNRRIKLLDSEFRKTDETAKAFGNSVDQLSNKEEYLTQKISLQTQKVEDMKREYERIRKEKGDNSKETEKYATSLNYAERALIKLEKELMDTTVKLKDQSAKFEDAKKKMGEFSDKAKAISDQTGKVGDALLKASAPLIAFSVASGKMAMDFEESMAIVSLMVDEGEADMESMGESVKALSRQYGISTKDIANALYETISAGVGVADSIKFLDVALKNSKSGRADVLTSVNALTNAMNAYGIETNRVLEVSDKMIMVQKYGKATVGQFGDELGRLAPIAAQAGVTIEEMFGSIATLTRNSIRSNEALTGMRSIISAVLKPTAEASKEAERLGLQFNASALKGQGFEKFLERVMSRTRGNTESLTKLFGNVNALNSIMLLTSEKGSKDFKDALDAINNSIGITDEGMDKLDTRSMRLSQTIENLKNSFADAGSAILPILDTMLRMINPLFTLISNIPEPLMYVIAGLGMFLGVSGGVLKTISSLTLGVALLTGSLTGFTLVSAKTTLIILGVVAALIALLTLIAVLSGKSKDLKSSMSSIGSDVANIQGTVNGAMQPKNIPRYARGTRNHPGGPAIVGEEGPELVDLPRGSRVYTNKETKGMLGTGNTYVLQVNMDEVDEVYKLVQVWNNFTQAKRAGVVGG